MGETGTISGNTHQKARCLHGALESRACIPASSLGVRAGEGPAPAWGACCPISPSLKQGERSLTGLTCDTLSQVSLFWFGLVFWFSF